MLGISILGAWPTAILYILSFAVFVMAAIGVALHEKVSNLVALGLGLAAFVSAWNAFAAATA